MPIGEVLEKAFKYPWKNKALWFFGVLLAIFSAGTSITNQYEVNESDFAFLEKINAAQLWLIGACVFAVAVAFVIISLIITSWSKVAIARGTVMIEEGKEISRKEIGLTGKRPVWKLIVLNALIPVMILFALLVVTALLVAVFYFMPQPAGLWTGIAVGIIFFFALIPLLVYWSYIWVLAARFVALEEMNAFAALRAGRKLIKEKFWWTFLLGIVLGMISGAASFVAILPLVFLIGIAVFLVIGKILIGAIIVGGLALLYLAVYVIIIGYFVAFENTGWTIWWLKLKEIKDKDAVISSKVVIDSKIKSKKKGK